MAFFRLIFLSLASTALFAGGLIALNPLNIEPAYARKEKDTAQNMAPGQCSVIIMYGASWCGVCKSREAEMKAQGIAFTEYLVDQDRKAKKIFLRKIKGTELEHYGYPTFEVNSRLYKNYDPSYLVEQSCL